MRGRAPVLAPTWGDALDAWAAYLRSEGRATSTIAQRCNYVRAFANDSGCNDPAAVGLDDLSRWLDSRSSVPTTASQYRSALRTFFGWAQETGRVESNPALFLDAANAARPASRRVARPVGRFGPLPRWTPGSWELPLAEWAREQRARGVTAGTLRVWSSHLRRLAREHQNRGPFSLTFHELVDFLAARTDWSASTRRGCRSAFRSFYGWAAEAGHIETDPASRLPAVRSKPYQPRPAAETAVHFAILTATDRERLMVRLAAELGLRCAEIAQVHSRDLREGDNGWSLVVHGKGSRDRVLPLPSELTAELRSLPGGWVFPSPAGGHITAGYVGVLIGRLLPEGVTAHTLRHRFATRTYAMTRDVLVVQQLLGHARPETTQRYVEVGDDRLRDAVVGLAATTTRAPQPTGVR